MKDPVQCLTKWMFIAALVLSLPLIGAPEAEAQQTIEVEAGTNNIAAALQQASSGDTIELVTEGGLYKDTTLVIDKDITIRAQDGVTDAPTVVYDESNASGNFVQMRIANPATRVMLENFTMGRPAGDGTAQPRNMIQHTADAERLDFFIYGMEFRNVANKVLATADDADPAVFDSLVVKRTYAHHAGNNVFDLKSTGAPDNDILTANYVEFENVTIAQTTDLSSAIGFMTKGGRNSSDLMELQFNHVTMDQVKIGMNINRTPVDCEISEIKNSIITRTQDQSKPAIRWNGLCTFEVSHMVTAQTGGFGGGNISSAESFTWDQLYYRDASTGDYGVQDGSPGTVGNMPASDGEDRGDLLGYDDVARLPVELSSFEAVRSGDTVQLSWSTASETNNAYFEVLRDAGDGWRAIGQRQGAGTTSEAQFYTFTDGAIPAASAQLTYRLRQVDLDGTETLSDPVTVELGPPDAFTMEGAAPNPFQGSTTVRYSLAESARVSVSVFDALGRRVATLVNNVQQSAGLQTVRFEASDLSAGMYFVRVNADDRTMGVDQLVLVE